MVSELLQSIKNYYLDTEVKLLNLKTKQLDTFVVFEIRTKNEKWLLILTNDKTEDYLELSFNLLEDIQSYLDLIKELESVE